MKIRRRTFDYSFPLFQVPRPLFRRFFSRFANFVAPLSGKASTNPLTSWKSNSSTKMSLNGIWNFGICNRNFSRINSSKENNRRTEVKEECRIKILRRNKLDESDPKIRETRSKGFAFKIDYSHR